MRFGMQLLLLPRYCETDRYIPTVEMQCVHPPPTHSLDATVSNTFFMESMWVLLFVFLPAPTFWYLLRSSVTEKGPFLISSIGPTVYARRVKCFTGTTGPPRRRHPTPLGRLIMQPNIQMLCSVLGCRATSGWGSSHSYYWWCSYVQEFVYYCEGPLCVSSLMSAKCYALVVINNF